MAMAAAGWRGSVRFVEPPQSASHLHRRDRRYQCYAKREIFAVARISMRNHYCQSFSQRARARVHVLGRAWGRLLCLPTCGRLVARRWCSFAGRMASRSEHAPVREGRRLAGCHRPGAASGAQLSLPSCVVRSQPSSRRRRRRAR